MTVPVRRWRSLGWVALCIIGSGILTYGFLALVARWVPVVGYGSFGSFWSLALLVGFGAFLPVELELARLLQSGAHGSRLPRGTAVSLTVLTVGSALLLVGFSGTLVPALGGHVTLLVALLALCVVSAAQFLLRGIMLGNGWLGLHGGVLLLDSGLRVALAALAHATVARPDATTFAWTLVAAISLAHLPVLAVVLVRRLRVRRTAPTGSAGTATKRPFVVAVGHLLVGSLCAQALLNAPPVLIPGLARGAEGVVAAQFVASYTLVRLPLFVAVPLQSALIPMLTQMHAEGGRRALRRVVVRGLAAVSFLSLLAAATGLLVGPMVVRLLFGGRYALPGPDIGLMAAGSVLYLGLLVASQTLVADARHRHVAAVWSAGLTAAVVMFLVVPSLALRGAAGFTVGSGAALAVAAWMLLTGRRRAGQPGITAAVVAQEGSRS